MNEMNSVNYMKIGGWIGLRDRLIPVRQEFFVVVFRIEGCSMFERVSEILNKVADIVEKKVFLFCFSTREEDGSLYEQLKEDFQLEENPTLLVFKDKKCKKTIIIDENVNPEDIISILE